MSEEASTESLTANEQILVRLSERFRGAIVASAQPYGLLTLEIIPSALLEVVFFLKNEPDMDYSFLTDLCGIHYPRATGKELGVIYHLHSLRRNSRIRLKTFVGLAMPVLDTLTGLFLGANWMERETYDFYGIVFSGHPDLRRILNMDEMTVFPMRKEFPLEDPNRKDKHDEYFGR